jgi:hypothetical protein
MTSNEQLFLVLVVTTLATIIGIYLYVKPRVEGFKTKADEKRQEIANRIDNVLLNVIDKAKNVSSYLSNTGLWKERIELAKMSYMELARSQLKPSAKKTSQ